MVTVESAGLVERIVLPRQSGTHADIYAAVGLAELLSTLSRDRGIRLVDEGTAIAVELSRPRRLSELTTRDIEPGYSYLQSKSVVGPPAGVREVLDYQATRELVNLARRAEEQLFKTQERTHRPPTPEERAQVDALWPMPRQAWRVWPVLLTLQGHETANKVHARIVQTAPEQLAQQVGAGLQALAEGRLSGLDWPVSTVQLFSPLAAKGYARLKPDSVGRGDKTKDAWADPFLEWLRYRGYFLATVPVFHGSNGEHIRLLCPVPGDISLVAYRAVVAELPAPRASAPKIDILATLTLARLLIERSEEFATGGQASYEGLRIRGKTPARVIAGLAITNFQSLGSARAVSALGELALPGWFPIETQADAEAWLEILEEHRAVVRGLQDNHSDEFALLQGYRRFLERREQRALEAFVDFAGAYGTLVLRAREAKRRIRQFRTDLFRRVVTGMSEGYAAILEDDGFQAVAAAVRRSTVSAQSLKSQGQDHREIRYGLLPELRRARELPGSEPLLAAVAELVSLYNSENARRRETRRQAPRNVTTDELLSFTRLVDQRGASIVGALLCAYGTCRDPRQPDAPSADDSDDATGADESTEYALVAPDEAQ